MTHNETPRASRAAGSWGCLLLLALAGCNALLGNEDVELPMAAATQMGATREDSGGGGDAAGEQGGVAGAGSDAGHAAGHAGDAGRSGAGEAGGGGRAGAREAGSGGRAGAAEAGSGGRAGAAEAGSGGRAGASGHEPQAGHSAGGMGASGSHGTAGAAGHAVGTCQAQSCEHGGKCSATASGPSCDCANTGYTGATCADAIDDCASKPCQNGGMCMDAVNDYACVCQAGWSGKQCETGAGCDYAGAHFGNGDTFTASDKCNTCRCTLGKVACSARACVTACGGRMGNTCATGQFCNYPEAAVCGDADATGTCEAVPSVCNDLVMAVCGCDGKTYPNACNAFSHSVSVRKSGECASNGCSYAGKSLAVGASVAASDGCNTCTCQMDGTVVCTKLACDPTTCGGIAGIKCASGKYCKFDAAAKCGAADATGTCSVRPDACTANYAPVCGCDGKTYSNACAAAVAGQSVRAQDACP